MDLRFLPNELGFEAKPLPIPIHIVFSSVDRSALTGNLPVGIKP
jgi:hypothetical protein